MTTRRHPRSLNEAFPRTAAYAETVEHYRAPGYSGVWWTLFTAVSVAALFVIWRTA
jgi:hypothetical protein